jgi:hypothetical protein
MNDGHLAAAVGKRSADAILKLPVRLHGLTLARPVDVLLDCDDLRIVGLDLLCGDEEHRFLPLAAATLGDDAVSISSPLVLLEDTELAFYRSRTLSLAALRGRPVRRREVDLGVLRDLVFGDDLAIEAVVLGEGGREVVVPYDDSLQFDPRSRSAA